MDSSNALPCSCSSFGLTVTELIWRIVTAGPQELKDYMKKQSKLPGHEQLADFHLLLYLSKLPNFNLEEDMSVIAEAVKHKANIPEGYRMIIDAI